MDAHDINLLGLHINLEKSPILSSWVSVEGARPAPDSLRKGREHCHSAYALGSLGGRSTSASWAICSFAQVSPKTTPFVGSAPSMTFTGCSI